MAIDPVVAGLAGDCFEHVVEDFLATGPGCRLFGHAPSVLVDAPAIVAFAIQWLERRFPAGSG